MNLEVYDYEFEKKVLGEEEFKTIVKAHNLFTKKHTIGRFKAFKKELNQAVQNKLNRRKRGK